MANSNELDRMQDIIALGATFDASMAEHDRAYKLWRAADRLLCSHYCPKCPGYKAVAQTMAHIAACLDAGNAVHEALFNAQDWMYFPKLLTA